MAYALMQEDELAGTVCQRCDKPIDAGEPFVRTSDRVQADWTG